MPNNMTTMREQPLVSVVTPVHNGERYLRRCIESVIAQSHVNWDYTIVNNCSTDGTLGIALEYASRDHRIRVQSNSSFLHINANYNMAFRQISPQSEVLQSSGGRRLAGSGLPYANGSYCGGESQRGNCRCLWSQRREG